MVVLTKTSLMIIISAVVLVAIALIIIMILTGGKPAKIFEIFSLIIAVLMGWMLKSLHIILRP
jgi:hypothetical protein